MKIILDVNILIAALIRDSTVRRIIIEKDHEWYFPEQGLAKIEKYKELIIEKTELSGSELEDLVSTILKYCTIVKKKDIEAHWQEAEQIMGTVDVEDAVIIATALSIEDAVIWSDDRHFERQNRIRTLKTPEVVSLLAKKQE